MPAPLKASGEARWAFKLDLSALSTATNSISATSGCPSEEVTLIPPKPTALAKLDHAKQAKYPNAFRNDFRTLPPFIFSRPYSE
jgi:hypothetical protein